MRILFLHQGQNHPSTRFRIYPWLPYLEKEGIHWEERPKRGARYQTLPYPFDFKRSSYIYLLESILQTTKYRNYDITFLQNYLYPPRFQFLDRLLRFNRYLIFDIQDAIFIRIADDNPIYEKRLRRLCDTASLLMVSNKFMMEWVGLPEKTIIMPTVLDCRRIPERNHGLKRKKIVVGWNGQKNQLHWIKPLFNVFATLSKIENVEIVIITSTIDETSELKRAGIKIIPFNKEREFEILQQIDVGLMPMENTQFALGKFSLKLIQYMAAGASVVCSPIGSNLEIVEDGVNGYFASDLEEWYHRILELINNPQKRIAMGKAGRMRVEQKYSTEANWPRFRHGLYSVLTKDSG